MSESWKRFDATYLRYDDLGIALDISRMGDLAAYLDSMEERSQAAFEEMRALEAGAVANADEGRMVGHYWLRNPGLAPAPLGDEIVRDFEAVKAFARRVHGREIVPAAGGAFTRVLLVGIGGSALGPQLVADALTGPGAPMAISFFDNTDPAGMEKTLRGIGEELRTTLTVVVSKSGGTPETRNGMVLAEAAYGAMGLRFGDHAVAVTGQGSQLDRHAEAGGWLARFPMADWIGGRTSVMSVVGLVPAALQGVDVDAFLAGARAMDEKTRVPETRRNLAMLLALMWYHAGCGKGNKDMVVLPYKDSLVLFSKYLQQLVMESLGKEKDRDGKVVNQGIAVYGNKGSTDQHAYVQQLRDGVANFFATFVEVREAGVAIPQVVEEGVTAGDYLQGFLRGTRRALAESGRESLLLSLPRVDAFTLGALIAVFERAVSFYASLVNVNAYHQPGVEAGKKAAAGFLEMLARVRAQMAVLGGPVGAEELAASTGDDPEDVYHALVHMVAQDGSVRILLGSSPAMDRFVFGAD